MLKCQLHTHCSDDPVDKINYSATELIDKAAKLKIEVLSITCHRKIIFSPELKKYADEKNILLIPGIEFEVNGKHILAINVHDDIYQIDNFKKLKIYKKNHPKTLIIAAHPFFPSKNCLKKDFIENIELFDAVENSFAYTKLINFNKKATKIAHQKKMPVLATADCHILDYLDYGFFLLESQKNIKSVVENIKKNKIKNYSQPASLYTIFKFFFTLTKQRLIM